MRWSLVPADPQDARCWRRTRHTSSSSTTRRCLRPGAGAICRTLDRCGRVGEGVGIDPSPIPPARGRGSNEDVQNPPSREGVGGLPRTQGSTKSAARPKQDPEYGGLRRGCAEFTSATTDSPHPPIGLDPGHEPRFEMFVYVDDVDRRSSSFAQSRQRSLSPRAQGLTASGIDLGRPFFTPAKSPPGQSDHSCGFGRLQNTRRSLGSPERSWSGGSVFVIGDACDHLVIVSPELPGRVSRSIASGGRSARFPVAGRAQLIRAGGWSCRIVGS